MKEAPCAHARTIMRASVSRARGVTQARYAEQLGISHATLSALENGRGVSSATLEKAFQPLGLRLIVLPKDAEARVTLRTAREG